MNCSGALVGITILSNKKLYAVTIERVIMVMAEDEDAACDVALKFEYDNLDGYPDNCLADPVMSDCDIPKEWMDSVPYSYGRNDHDNRTCKQILFPNIGTHLE
jgi:hypothetical protein